MWLAHFAERYKHIVRLEPNFLFYEFHLSDSNFTNCFKVYYANILQITRLHFSDKSNSNPKFVFYFTSCSLLTTSFQYQTLNIGLCG